MTTESLPTDPGNGAGRGSPWYADVTKYQWLVLLIASAGWMFDVYEGQIFNITRNDMLGEILGDGAKKEFWGDVFLAIFLAGGTVGGFVFGSLADRYGRRPIMIATILMYSVFSGMTYFANDIYTVGVLRFLVAIGIGGEWAVAASLVSEVFSTKARAHASSIFHASSVLGTWLAAISAIMVGVQWRYAYLLGVLPALLIVAVRVSLKEPPKQPPAKDADGREVVRGSFRELLLNPRWAWRAVGGLLLAAVGLGTFWSVTIEGQNLVRELLVSRGVDGATAGTQAKFAYGIVQAGGGGLGLLAFGPISARLGRKKTFQLFQFLALLIVPVVCFVPQTYMQMLIVLPFFGFLTLGMHSGYAVYFPELFPDHIRATGASFCFNGGRLLAVPILVFSGWLKSLDGVTLPVAVTGLSLLFIAGILIVSWMPETNRADLIESDA